MRETAAVALLHFDYFTCSLRTQAYMDGAVGTVIIKTIERDVRCDPVDDLEHIFVPDQKIHGSSATLANHFAARVHFVRRMLIQLWLNSPADLLCKRR